MKLQLCEECKEYKASAHYRSDFRAVLCTDCHLIALRRNSPTGLVKVTAKLRREANAISQRRNG